MYETRRNSGKVIQNAVHQILSESAEFSKRRNKNICFNFFWDTAYKHDQRAHGGQLSTVIGRSTPSNNHIIPIVRATRVITCTKNAG